MVRQADEIAVYAFKASTPLYSSIVANDISSLAESVAVKDPKGFLKCACVPLVSITLSRKGKQLGSIGVYPELDLLIGFSAWSGDASPVDPEKLLQWFDRHGIPSPRRFHEGQVALAKADRVASERWLRATPPSLRPLWGKLIKDGFSSAETQAEALHPALIQAYPNATERIRVLFAWFGSGAGPWSGYPGYEEVVAQLLLKHPPRELVAALQGKTLTEPEMEGAARLFSCCAPGVPFRATDNKTLIRLIPQDLKKALFEHVRKTGNEDNLDRARASLVDR